MFLKFSKNIHSSTVVVWARSLFFSYICLPESHAVNSLPKDRNYSHIKARKDRAEGTFVYTLISDALLFSASFCFSLFCHTLPCADVLCDPFTSPSFPKLRGGHFPLNTQLLVPHYKKGLLKAWRRGREIGKSTSKILLAQNPKLFILPLIGHEAVTFDNG